MGNSKSTRQTPRAPVNSTNSSTLVAGYHPDVYNTLTKSPPPPPISPIYVPPLVPTTENVSDIPPISTTSPTFAFPVISPTPANPISPPLLTTRVFSPSTVIPIEVPTAVIPVEHPITTSPINSSTPTIPIDSPTPRVSVPSPIAVVPVNSPIPLAPETSWSPDIPIPSPPPADNNAFSVISPDTSAVSPTLNFFTTPRASPLPTETVIPLQSVVSSDETHSTAHATHDVSTSPMARLVPTTTRPAEVTRKQSISKDLTVPPAPNVTPVKHLALSSADRSSIWSKLEREQQEKQKRLGLITLRTERPNKSTVSASRTSKTDLEITPVTPAIVAVPSFPLRSTAVYNPSEDHHTLSERTQSIYTDLSIFKYYVTYNEAKYVIGDHTKATMFQMDTRLKQTPLPLPSLSLVTKNVSDGSHEIEKNAEIAPSLGLQHDLESESIEQSSTPHRLHEKQQQRKHRQSSVYTNNPPDRNNSFQYATSTVINQADFITTNQTTVPNNRQPFTSILKKPAFQFNTNPISTEANNKLFPEFQSNDIENNPLTVSFNLSSSFRTKANQSISRSEYLIHRKKPSFFSSQN